MRGAAAAAAGTAARLLSSGTKRSMYNFGQEREKEEKKRKVSEREREGEREKICAGRFFYVRDVFQTQFRKTVPRQFFSPIAVHTLSTLVLTRIHVYKMYLKIN